MLNVLPRVCIHNMYNFTDIQGAIQHSGTGEKEYVQTNLPMGAALGERRAMAKAVPTRSKERASFISDGEVELVCIRG